MNNLIKMIIFANWKIYMTSREQVKKYVEVLKKGLKNFNDEVLEVHIMADFLSFEYIKKNLADTNIKCGVQDIFWEDHGPFAGEVSPLMLKDIGCDSVYLGHSERKTLFGETEENINKKLHACLRNSIKPFMFVGETLEELKSHMTKSVIKRQLKIGLQGVSKTMLKDIVIIYEPRWAIGKKESASNEIISSMHSMTRRLISELYGTELAQDIPILYGGSVNLENISKIITMREVDGVGAARAAINPDDFIRLVRIVEKEAINRYQFKK